MEIRSSSHLFSFLRAEKNTVTAGILALLISFGLCLFFQMEQREISYCQQMFRIKSGYFWMLLTEFHFFQGLFTMSCGGP